MTAPASCAVGHCLKPASKDGLCTVHALTWLLTKESAPTPGRESRLRDFVVRQDIRHTLKQRETQATSPAE